MKRALPLALSSVLATLVVGSGVGMAAPRLSAASVANGAKAVAKSVPKTPLKATKTKAKTKAKATVKVTKTSARVTRTTAKSPVSGSSVSDETVIVPVVGFDAPVSVASPVTSAPVSAPSTTVPGVPPPLGAPAVTVAPVSVAPVSVAPVSVAPVSVAPVSVAAVSAAVAPTIPVVASPTAASTTAPPTTVAFPAAAMAPTRRTATTLEPYRGLGAWVDVLDWSVLYGKKPVANVSTIDKMAAQGIQTLYLQGSRSTAPTDVLEPERLIPMIDRAHQLGLYVVLWYLPDLTDVNLDLRRSVALANLDVDGLSIDIETTKMFGAKDLGERNRRQLLFSQQLRALTPGRQISATVLPPVDTDSPTYKLWPKFPYADHASSYDAWVIMNYWSSWKAESGWRDGYRYTIENINRLRAYGRRPEMPIHVIGGVGDKLDVPDVPPFVRAAQEAGAFGGSWYDWGVSKPGVTAQLWGLRYTAPGQPYDSRFIPPLPPPTSTTTLAPAITAPASQPSVTAAPVTAPPTQNLSTLPPQTTTPVVFPPPFYGS